RNGVPILRDRNNLYVIKGNLPVPRPPSARLDAESPEPFDIQKAFAQSHVNARNAIKKGYGFRVKSAPTDLTATATR
uniref:hypothetical protein n=1 Tax=Bilophila wadsworthia TaxID=35833 RepID=UPI003FEED8DE